MTVKEDREHYHPEIRLILLPTMIYSCYCTNLRLYVLPFKIEQGESTLKPYFFINLLFQKIRHLHVSIFL